MAREEQGDWDGRERRMGRGLSEDDARLIAEWVEQIRTASEDKQLAKAARLLLRAAVLALAAVVVGVSGSWNAIKALMP